MTEEFKNLAYSMKDLAHIQRNVNTKILRAFRAQQKRIERIEKHLKIVPSEKELLDFNDTNEEELK